VQRLLASVGADAIIRVRPDTGDDRTVLPRLLTDKDLRRSLLQVFGSYTQYLLYRGSQTTTFGAPGEEGLTWMHDELVTAERTLVLGEGVLPPAVAATLLVLLAAVCLVLALGCGLGRRWAETMDGFSVLRFGADAERLGFSMLRIIRERWSGARG